MARPKTPIDPERVERLAAIGCSAAEIGAELAPEGRPAIDHKTIERRFGVTLKKAADRRKCRIRSWLHKEAAKGNTAIIIFLAKVELGMKEHDPLVNLSVTANANSSAPIAYTPEQREKLAELAAAVMRRAAEHGGHGNGDGDRGVGLVS